MRSIRTKRILLAALILVSSVTVAYFTNPDEAQHYTSVENYLEQVDEDFPTILNTNVIDYKIFGLTAVLVSSKETDNELQYNYRIIGVGAFGKVLTLFDPRNSGIEYSETTEKPYSGKII